MLKITRRAAHALMSFRRDRQVPDEQGVRLVPDQRGRIRMVFDAPTDMDEVQHMDWRPLLIMDRTMAQYLADMVLDLRSEEQMLPGGGFVLRVRDGPRLRRIVSPTRC